jgi:hypothetical protein
MRTTIQMLAGVLSVLLLSACDKGPAPLGAAPDKPASAAEGGRSPAAVETSVPPADSVAMPSAAPAGSAAAVGRSNSPMTAREESGAMPLPGQNNDHSAPASNTKAPSTP